MLEYIFVPETAKNGDFRRTGAKAVWGDSIPGVAKFSRLWLIPKDAEKPADGRHRKRGDRIGKDSGM